MRMLVLCADIPSPTTGANARNYHLLRALASQHTVSCLALVRTYDKQAASAMSSLNELVRTLRVVHCQATYSNRWQQLLNVVRRKSHLLYFHIVPEVQAALDEILADDTYDAVLFESVLLAGYRLPSGMKIIIDQHNIEYEVLQRTSQYEKMSLRKWYNWQESHLLKQGEIARCRAANLLLVTSERERLLLQKILPKQCPTVVPNGVDTEAFQGQDTEHVIPNQIIFTGTMDYYPNVEAVVSFARTCWPLIRAQVPDATWLIVGRNPLPEVQRLADLPGVTVTGSVPDVRPYLAQSAVAIAPLHIGSGTRLKILEAFAMHKAVVTTALGCEGLAVDPGKHALVADTPEAFAEAVMKLLANRLLCTTLGDAGRSLVEAEYQWNKCGARLLQALETW